MGPQVVFLCQGWVAMMASARGGEVCGILPPRCSRPCLVLSTVGNSMMQLQLEDVASDIKSELKGVESTFKSQINNLWSHVQSHKNDTESDKNLQQWLFWLWLCCLEMLWAASQGAASQWLLYDVVSSAGRRAQLGAIWWAAVSLFSFKQVSRKLQWMHWMLHAP